MDIKEGEVHVWRYSLNVKEYELERTEPLLSWEEKERCKRYINEKERIRYTCNHRFVRQVLSGYLSIPAQEITFHLSEMGKPYLKNSNIYFNYSYRTTLGLLAISNGSEIGADIERMKPLQDVKTFSDFSFSEKEKEILFKCPEEKFQDTLFTFWTFKEAMIKAIGVGLNADITKIDLSDFIERAENILPYSNTLYTMRQIHAEEGYKAAFAVAGKMTRYSEYSFPG